MNERRPHFKKPKNQEPDGLLYGIHPVTEAILAGKTIEKAYLQSNLRGEHSSELLVLFKKHNVPFQYVPVEKLNSFTRSNHQGVVAMASPIEYADIEAIIPKLFEEAKQPFILILDRITDVRNFGAIARTAECCGVHAIIVPDRGGAPASADAMKTSAGALNRLPVCRLRSLSSAVEYLKESGLQIVACTEKTDDSLYQTKATGPVAVIMGSEEDGISEYLLKLADSRVKIPMMGDIGSLNVSVAAGVICYEIVRQRAKKAKAKV